LPKAKERAVALNDRYRTIQDLPSELPVFPLRGCILLPRATLPLNIFEPRYLAMIGDVLSGNRVVGIVQPSPEAGGAESPTGKSAQLCRIGCAGRLTSFEELDDGRYVIMLTGICRFEVEAELETDKPYRSMRVDYRRFAGDLTPGAGEDQVDRDGLIAALRSYLDAKRLEADWKSIERSGAELIVNAMSMMCPHAPEEKQALLEAETLCDRADTLLTLGQMELASGFSSNAPKRLQ